MILEHVRQALHVMCVPAWVGNTDTDLKYRHQPSSSVYTVYVGVSAHMHARMHVQRVQMSLSQDSKTLIREFKVLKLEIDLQA